MKALLLAAGFGPRLGNLTKNTPKPLIKVNNKPILAFCLEQLMDAGVSEVIINTHYLADQITEFVNKNVLPIKIVISHEAELLGTAGTLKKHIDRLAEEDFIVMHADNYFADTIRSFANDHQSRKVGIYGSLGIFETTTPENCGVVILNNDRTIREFYEKVSNPPSNLANAAIYIFTPLVRESLMALKEGENDISRNLIPMIMNGLYAHHFEGLFVDIGSPDGLRKAENYAAELSRSNTI